MKLRLSKNCCKDFAGLHFTESLFEAIELVLRVVVATRYSDLHVFHGIMSFILVFQSIITLKATYRMPHLFVLSVDLA